MLDIREDALSAIVDLAQYVELKGSVVVVQDDIAESLRWNGGTELLLRDFGVANILSWMSILTCENAHDIQNLCSPFHWDMTVAQGNENKPLPNIIILVSSFLAEIKFQLQHIVRLGGISSITVCSTLSEKAQECYLGAHQVKKFSFAEYEAELQALARGNPQVSAPKDVQLEKPADDWEWGEDFSEEEDESRQESTVASTSSRDPSIQVRHVPLHFSTIVNSKMKGAPSTFILTQPRCAAVFPLLLCHLPPEIRHKYSHIKEIEAEDIPSSSRQSFKLLAHTLGDILTQMRLDVRPSIGLLRDDLLLIEWC